MSRLALVLAASVLPVSAAQATAPKVLHETARNGGVAATLRYVQVAPARWDVTLSVRRHGAQVYDAPVPRHDVNEPLHATFRLQPSIRVRDLDGDGEPEIVVDFWTGGAHCCQWSRVYRFDGRTYTGVDHDWGESTYTLQRLGGRLRLVSRDGRFAYVFACYACSGFPRQIWADRHGRLVDVTREYPRRVAADAAYWWKELRGVTRAGSGETRGLVSAWVADECLLGRGSPAFAWLRSHESLYTSRFTEDTTSGAAFRRALRRYLVKLGYLR